MNPADTWTYAGADSCCQFFTACLREAAIDVPSTAHVLEVGCGEFDWLTPAAAAWPEMTFDGIDWRCKAPHTDPRVTRVQGNVLDADAYPPDTFDWVVSISTLEHIGLGHYAQDPLDAEGDTHALAHIWRWLKPGGWLLFDVPYDPSGYRKVGTECRVYDQAALEQRLWAAVVTQAAAWRQTWYCHAGACTELLPPPAKPVQPFHYCGLLWRKLA
jgi:SAM-dependent methyltransferase